MYGILKDIIFEKAQLKNYNSSDNSFYLKEQNEAICKRVDLLHFESEKTTFGFELDSKHIRYRGIHKISPYFENGKGFDKGNDGIIFTTIQKKNYIFVCELKDGAKGFVTQFKSSLCFIEYLKAILQIYYNYNTDDFIVKYLVFSKRGKSHKDSKGKFITTKQDGIDFYHLPCSQTKYYITSFI